MLDLLRKIFIRNYDHLSDPVVRREHGILAAAFGVVTNLVLFVFKLLIGILTVSIAIITDAVNNLTDFGSCIVDIFGFIMAGKPADEKHPYGHERIEYVTGMIVSFTIVCVAVLLGYHSVTKIISNEQSNPGFWTFIILGGAILIKLMQGFFYRKMARLTKSVTLKASSGDSFIDVIATSVVLLSSLVQFILVRDGIAVPFSIDGITGVVLSLFIVISGMKLIIETGDPLIGASPDHALVKSVTDDIQSYPGVLGVHDVLYHSYGPTKTFVTIHVEVDGKASFIASHDLADKIEHEVGKKHGVTLTIHMDPVDTDSEKARNLKEKTEAILHSLNDSLSLHDFRVVESNEKTKIVFDVLIPFAVKAKEQEISEYVNQELRKLSETYSADIDFDHGSLE